MPNGDGVFDSRVRQYRPRGPGRRHDAVALTDAGRFLIGRRSMLPTGTGLERSRASLGLGRSQRRHAGCGDYGL